MSITESHITLQTFLRHKKRLNSLWCGFIFISRRIPAYIRQLRWVYTNINHGRYRYTAYACVYPRLQPCLHVQRTVSVWSKSLWEPCVLRAYLTGLDWIVKLLFNWYTAAVPQTSSLSLSPPAVRYTNMGVSPVYESSFWTSKGHTKRHAACSSQSQASDHLRGAQHSSTTLRWCTQLWFITYPSTALVLAIGPYRRTPGIIG